MPIHILQAEIDAELEAREVLRFRAPLMSALLDDEDRHDREAAFSRLAAANKVLAAWNPLLVLKAGGVR
ncbi:hypothetical protein ACH492_22460 [Streptomyces sp. NPDC019443]|uniref:hypothetical protein n=1 Tax=Streptomyces sp. NPDC019443 TaxID=3365061 RepID=UPI0037B9F762